MPARQTYDDLVFYFVRGAFVVGGVLMVLFALAAAADILFAFGWGFSWIAVYAAFASAVLGFVGSIGFKYLHRLYGQVRESGGAARIVRGPAAPEAAARRRLARGFKLAAIRAFIVFAFLATALWLLNALPAYPWEIIVLGIVMALLFEMLLLLVRRFGPFRRSPSERP
jgi:hypothetical protein